jgi:hypothetical protein
MPSAGRETLRHPLHLAGHTDSDEKFAIHLEMQRFIEKARLLKHLAPKERSRLGQEIVALPHQPVQIEFGAQ